MDRKKLVISLVTYNGAAYLPACLDSISRQTLHDIEVVVLDNASSDGTVAVVRELAPHVRVIVLSENTGFSRGHNAVIRDTVSEYVLVLNQDVVLGSDYCERLVTFLDKNLEYSSTTGLLTSGSQEDLTKGVFGDTVDSAGIAVGFAQRPANIGAVKLVSNAGASREVWGVSAAAALYRRSALEDVAITIDRGNVEYFDEDFFMYHDDSDLSYRLRWRGWRAWCEISARAVHIRTRRDGAGEFFKRSSVQINYWSYRNRWWFIAKNVSGGVFIRSGIAIALFEIAKFGYLVLFERATLRALIDVKKGWARMMSKRSMIMKGRTISDAEMIKTFSLR